MKRNLSLILLAMLFSFGVAYAAGGDDLFGFTAGRVYYGASNGSLTSEAAFTYDASTNTLTAGTLSGNVAATNLDGILGANTPAAATATTLTATGNVTMNDAGADTILIGAAADTLTLTSNTLSVTDDNWSITAAGVATFASVNKVALTAPASAATLTLADGSTLATSGAFSTTLTATGATNVTLPTTGTLATLAGTEALTNKTVTSPTIGGTTVAAAGLMLAHENGTGTAAAGAVTVNTQSVVVTTESLTTAAGGDYTLTLTDSKISAGSNVLVTVGQGTSNAGLPHLMSVTPGAGSATIVVRNIHGAAAFNGNLIIRAFVAN